MQLSSPDWGFAYAPRCPRPRRRSRPAFCRLSAAACWAVPKLSLTPSPAGLCRFPTRIGRSGAWSYQLGVKSHMARLRVGTAWVVSVAASQMMFTWPSSAALRPALSCHGGRLRRKGIALTGLPCLLRAVRARAWQLQSGLSGQPGSHPALHRTLCLRGELCGQLQAAPRIFVANDLVARRQQRRRPLVPRLAGKLFRPACRFLDWPGCALAGYGQRCFVGLRLRGPNATNCLLRCGVWRGVAG